MPETAALVAEVRDPEASWFLWLRITPISSQKRSSASSSFRWMRQPGTAGGTHDMSESGRRRRHVLDVAQGSALPAIALAAAATADRFLIALDAAPSWSSPLSTCRTRQRPGSPDIIPEGSPN
ncbi:hypothetical protein U9M48_014178 [Paspalum notatum var. saurae]|uniref:Uncharacterized protein n=1 Tax=Paspalum notatum var. saurae TaxID=547442 RepID=A0AAQ3T0S1_PASNO